MTVFRDFVPRVASVILCPSKIHPQRKFQKWPQKTAETLPSDFAGVKPRHSALTLSALLFWVPVWDFKGPQQPQELFLRPILQRKSKALSVHFECLAFLVVVWECNDPGVPQVHCKRLGVAGRGYQQLKHLRPLS